LPTDVSPVHESASQTDVTPQRAPRQGWAYCLIIALLFGLWGLHAAGYNNIVDTDGARHAMNGAFIHDLIARGNYPDLAHFSKVVHFAKRYYGHLPALSLPYHPPLFPLFEAGFFFIFGVNVFAARLAVAIALALSAVLFFRLIMATYGSVFVAAFSAITFLSLPYALWLGSDVMLEFPALVFVLLAMRCLAGGATKYSIGRALLFAVLAAAAVWTKQQTVFLGMVPFFYFALLGRWRLFREPAIWVSSALFLALVAVLSMLSLPVHGAGVNQVATPAGHGHVFTRNLFFYFHEYPEMAGPVGVLLLVPFAVALAGRLVRREPVALYISWAISAMLLLLFLGPYSARYLFFVVAPMFVLGYASLVDIAGRWPAARRWVMAGSVAALVTTVVYGGSSPVVFMRGPDEAAQALTALAPHRILYCGGTDGNFIFSYRSYERQPLTTIIVAGDKLPASVFTPAGFDEFARRYGIEYIVLERAPGLTPRMKHPWEPLIDMPPSSVVPIRDIPLASSNYRWNGLLRIYRFTDPSPDPDEALTMRMNMIGGSMRFGLGQ
jgi:hypothetical protein